VRKHGDWNALRQIFRPQVTARTTPEPLGQIMADVVRPLGDTHIEIDRPDGSTYFEGYRAAPATPTIRMGSLIRALAVALGQPPSAPPQPLALPELPADDASVSPTRAPHDSVAMSSEPITGA
jgi:hypothetical protein